MHRAGMLLLLASCSSADPFEREAPQAWSGTEAFDDVTPWHRHERSGLAVRVVAKEPYRIGRPVAIRVEAKNLGERPVCFDTQALLHAPYGLTTADGRPAVHVLNQSGQSFQSFEVLEPGKEMVLDDVDLTRFFAFLAPGEYVANFWGLDSWGFGPEAPEGVGPPGTLLSGVPASAPLRLKVGPGPVSRRDQIVAKLQPALSKDWQLIWAGSEEDLRFRVRRREIRPYLDIWVDLAVRAVDSSWRRLGRSTWGEVWMGPFSAGAFRPREPGDAVAEQELRPLHLPDVERRIVESLDIRP